MIKHIPYIFSTAAIVGAIVFAVQGATQLAGILLIMSGLLYLFLSKSILETTQGIEEKVPQLKFVSRLIGGKHPNGMKLGGVILLAVGAIWVFSVR